MKEEFKLVSRKCGCGEIEEFLRLDSLQAVRAFHESFPVYEPTPLLRLNGAARVLGLGAVYVKDESKRFGLNAFKALGGSYAVGRYLAEQLGEAVSNITYGQLTSPEAKARLGDITFVTATDGNHGRGIAWTAAQFGHKSVVYMPKGSAQVRLENIRREGAEASITELNYDDAVRLAGRHAREYGWVLVQDTAWEGYETIPSWIMQGYGTMALEAIDQLPERPTHIFLQAGVGSMAGAVAGLFADHYGEERPSITIVEPNKADCIFRTAEANDGQLHFVGGDMDTIMAGLACGEPCSVAWRVLSKCADHFISCPDYAAETGMRFLGRPQEGDERIISGESGAACVGCVAEIMTDPALAWIRDRLRLDENSRVLFFSTEGDTDPENYLAVMQRH